VRVEYDAATDVAYIYLREAAADEWKHKRAAVPHMINLDFDREARLVRIEVLAASQRLPHEVLAGATWLRNTSATRGA
jgi:uncharacterized protein YuzE